MADRRPAANQPPTRRGLRPLADTVARVTGPLLRKRGFAEARIVTEWREIVGAALAQGCAPEKLTVARNGGGGTLDIRVEGALALELQHLQPQIIERVNGYFGYEAVDRIRLRQGPLPQRPVRRRPLPPPSAAAVEQVEATVATVEDPDLRAALDRLGRAIHARRPAAEASEHPRPWPSWRLNRRGIYPQLCPRDGPKSACESQNASRNIPDIVVRNE